ncbi:hypothetical protein BX616_002633, partial [Lobosporangium transversale]
MDRKSVSPEPTPPVWTAVASSEDSNSENAPAYSSEPVCVSTQQQQQQQQQQQHHYQQNSRWGQGTLASILLQPPPRYAEVHHSPVSGMFSYPPPLASTSIASNPAISTTSASTVPSSSSTVHSFVSVPYPYDVEDQPYFQNNTSTNTITATPFNAIFGSATASNRSSEASSLSNPLSSLLNNNSNVRSNTFGRSSEMPDWRHASISNINSNGSSISNNSPLNVPLPPSVAIPPNLSTSLPPQHSSSIPFQHRPPLRRSSSYERGIRAYQFHGPQHQQQSHQYQHHPHESVHHNPYIPPSFTSSRPFIPPKVKGYDFRDGSQAGNMGLMTGKRISDGMPVTGKLHQSRLLLQHEHRILKRLQIVNAWYDPSCSTQLSSCHTSNEGSTKAAETKRSSAIADSRLDIAETSGRNVHEPNHNDNNSDAETERSSSVRCKVDNQLAPLSEPGLREDEKYFNRVVEDFVDIDHSTEMSVLVMRRLGPNLLSSLHHRFLGLDETDGYQSPELRAGRLQPAVSPFSDVYTFLVFCLKAACVLEALERANLAHLALCPTALHWALPDSDVIEPTTSSLPERGNKEEQKAKPYEPNPTSLYHDPIPIISDNDTITPQQHVHCSSRSPPKPQQQSPQHGFSCESTLHSGFFNPYHPGSDINKTKLRLFDFTHSKILSHERARAPSNIVEWQVPGYLEYHLQFLAPEQTGRAETWMDHRTDIYGLGATLFTLLTMHFPNRGNDSVQILQGVLSRDLPPLDTFRPDMPPIIDDILRKMTQKVPKT